jgi:hypothetical protein
VVWSNLRTNKSASTLLLHRRRPSRRRLRVDGNVCLSFLQIDSLVYSPIFRSGEIYFSTCHWRSSFSTTALGIGARWMFWSEDIGPEVVDMSLFPDFVDGMRWILLQARMGMSPGRRAIATCALLVPAGRAYSSTHKASLAMVLLWIWQWWRLDVSSNVCLGGVGAWRRPLVSASAENPRNGFVFSIF